MYFLDTCVCVEFLRGRLTHGYQFMQKTRRSEFKIPAVVAAELWYGAAHSNDSEKQKSIVSVFLDAFEIVPFDFPCAKAYGELRQKLAAKGQPIGDRDTMIAAMALAHDATLVTNNTKEFKRVPNLHLEDWAEEAL